ncbi:MAG TPA: hypothetical protein VFB19_18470 [Mycobacterium sp.]|nr:hypothetical protein [Mycobacterium sp.]
MADDKKPKRLGAYAKLSATYYRDDAVLRAGEAAELLFARGLAFCAESPGNGYITDMQVTHVIGVGLKKLDARVETLVREELWTRVDGGYLVRSWLKWNRSAEQMSMDRKNDRERKARQAKADAKRNPDGKEPESARNPDGLTPDSLSETKTGTRTETEVPTTSGELALAAPNPDVGQLVGHFVDACRERPPSSVVARIGKEVRGLVGEGIQPDAIRGGLVIVAEKGLNPATLPSAIHEYLNARPRERRNGQDEILQRAMARARAAEGAT